MPRLFKTNINKSKVLNSTKNYRILGRVKERKPPAFDEEERNSKWCGVVMMITKLEGKTRGLEPTKATQVFSSQCALLPKDEEKELGRHSLSQTHLLSLLLPTVMMVSTTWRRSD